MKEYKYKINGNTYKVTIGDIDENIAHVEVNGTPYKVEMEKAPKVVVKPGSLHDDIFIFSNVILYFLLYLIFIFIFFHCFINL